MNDEIWTDLKGAALSLVGVLACVFALFTGALVWWIVQLVVSIPLAILLVRSRSARKQWEDRPRGPAPHAPGSRRPRA
jgi:hypothetical protein